MRLVLLALSFLFSVALAHAQFGQCTPDPKYNGAAVGVYPLPYDPATNPDGGINTSACKSFPYQFNFNVVVPDTINFPGFGDIPLESLSLATTGAFSNLPAGISYSCNPPNCIFLKNTVGCVALYGTVPTSVATGDYELIINGTIGTGLGISLPFTFPNASLYPGSYILKVEPEDGKTCYKVSTSEVRSKSYYGEINPNPVSLEANLTIFSQKTTQLKLEILSIDGKVLYSKKMFVQEGQNIEKIDVSNFANGVYMYRIADDSETALGKMVIQN